MENLPPNPLKGEFVKVMIIFSALDDMQSLAPPSGGWGADSSGLFSCILKESFEPDFAVEERFVLIQR